MKREMNALAAALLLCAPASLSAQQQAITAQSQSQSVTCTGTSQTRGTRTRGQPSPQFTDYDIILEVPNLCVRRINLAVRNLQAHVSLNATASNLVRVQAGADVSIKSVDLTIQGVHAEALLLVDLDNVYYIVDRTMTMLDNNPEIFKHLYSTAQNAVGTVGGLANTALEPGGVVSQTVGLVGKTLENVTLPGGLLSQTVNTLGQAVVRTLDTTGHIVERTVDATGKIVGSNAIGSVTALNVVKETAGTAGSVVRQVRDASGKIIEFTVDQAGKVTNSHVLR